MGGVFKKPVQMAQQMDVVKPVAAPAPVASPTTAEVSQSGATDMDGSKELKEEDVVDHQLYLTGSYGVQEGATLGTPTLLG
jgi:hypothetical protein